MMENICAPVIVYMAMGIIVFIVGLYKKLKPFTMAIKIAVIAFWICFLQLLCQHGYTTLSWLLVLLPFVIMLGVYAIAMETILLNQQQ